MNLKIGDRLLCIRHTKPQVYMTFPVIGRVYTVVADIDFHRNSSWVNVKLDGWSDVFSFLKEDFKHLTKKNACRIDCLVWGIEE